MGVEWSSRLIIPRRSLVSDSDCGCCWRRKDTNINNQGTLTLKRLYMGRNDSSCVYSGPESKLHVYGIITVRHFLTATRHHWITQIPITMHGGHFYGYNGVQLTNFSAHHSKIDLTSASRSTFRGQSNFTENFWAMRYGYSLADFGDVIFKGENHVSHTDQINDWLCVVARSCLFQRGVYSWW